MVFNFTIKLTKRITTLLQHTQVLTSPYRPYRIILKFYTQTLTTRLIQVFNLFFLLSDLQ